jgi:acetylornithine deacetylase/succinyl-diaminopimelate desuccinylase-like protein
LPDQARSAPRRQENGCPGAGGNPEDRGRYHGMNERLSVENFAECVRFYAQLIKNGDSL